MTRLFLKITRFSLAAGFVAATLAGASCSMADSSPNFKPSDYRIVRAACTAKFESDCTVATREARKNHNTAYCALALTPDAPGKLQTCGVAAGWGKSQATVVAAALSYCRSTAATSASRLPGKYCKLFSVKEIR